MAGEGPTPSPFRPAPRPNALARALPVIQELPVYRPNTAGRDALAAVTVAAVAVPAAMGYAAVAGVSPVNGLYALLLPTAGYALLGSSRQVMVGPDGALSALVGALVLGAAAAGSAQAGELGAMLALLVAGCFAIARLLRLGWLADYLSRPVLVGFIHGVVVVLVVGQLGKLLGVSVSATDPIPQLVEVAREIGTVSLTTLAVSAASLAVALPLRFRVPRFPAPLLLVVAGIAASSLLALDDHGVAVVGAIPSGLPSLSLPSPSFADSANLAPTALGLFLVAFADGVLTARTFAGRHGQHVDAGQKLLALGASNALAGISQGFPVGASNSRTAVSDALRELASTLAAEGATMVLARVKTPLQDRLDEGGVTAAIGAAHFCPTVHAAVEACAASPGSGDAVRARAPEAPLRGD